MDKFFKAIGGFFKKIWEWIKTTAWVQPLLIVAIIFGIIFSIQPIVNAIKDAVNDDETGEFYDDHKVKKFNKLYDGIKDQNNWYNRKSADKFILNKNSGDILVIYVDSDSTLEDDVSHFYATAKNQGCKLYVCNFKTKRNQKSYYDRSGKWYNHGYKDDDAATYYDFLLDRLQETYNGDVPVDEEGHTWREYNEVFSAEYGYDIFYPSFESSGIEKYESSSTEKEKAVNDLHLPAAVKYHNGVIQDMRFASSSSWTGYDSNGSSSNIKILSDMWTGASF